MTHTAAGTALVAAAKSVGFVDYDVLSGSAVTSKVWRLRAPNGRPFCVQANCKIPLAWLLPEHAASLPASVGGLELYSASRGRHSHLRQVREFNGSPLVKVALRGEPADIRVALAAFGGVASS